MERFFQNFFHLFESPSNLQIGITFGDPLLVVVLCKIDETTLVISREYIGDFQSKRAAANVQLNHSVART